MFAFWFIIFLLTAAALIFVIPPLLSQQNYTEESRQTSTNVAIYKERLQELEQEKLDDEDFQQRKQELEKSLAQELDSQQITYYSQARWTSAIIVGIIVPVVALGLYANYGRYELLQPAEAKQTEAAKHGQMPSDFEKMVDGLATRLEQQPDDIKGHYMLARSYAMLKRYPEAIEVYTKLVTLTEGKDPNILVDYAETAAIVNDNKLTGLPTMLLNNALEIDPKHVSALWLSGFAAREQDQLQQALDYWERLLPLLPENETDAITSLTENINQIKQVLGQPLIETTQVATKPAQATDNGDITATKPAQATDNGDAAATGNIQVSVRLDPSLQDKVQAGDTLFVYARATKGSPMPLAILRLSATDLPVQAATLDDTQAMMPSMKISNFEAVTVMARISKSGGAMEQPGDLKGTVTPVKLGQTVEVVINQVVP
ncbi:MAG: c-type cytochrome biogenesis protein CcmI [Thiotrichaceae bacterium]|nr:c-type cytochrome biogenesis protein CcmI [Thiotrichaceae bacterium]